MHEAALSYREAVSEALLALALEIGKRRNLKAPFARKTKIPPPVALISCVETIYLAGFHLWSLSTHPIDKECSTWAQDLEHRKSGGIYYTPPNLVDRILEFALSPCPLRDEGAEGVRGSARRICDPACGAGAFLVAAAKRIANDYGPKAVAKSIYGCDTDEDALQICRLSIWLETGVFLPKENLICADSLVYKWSFGTFDIVIGNPPFGGVVDGRVPENVKTRRATHFKELGGTADYAYYFASLANKLVKGDGRVGLILPRAFLSAQSTARLRNLNEREFVVIDSFSQHDAFDSASVYVCLAGFRPRAEFEAKNEASDLAPNSLQVTASLTVAEAYDLASSVLDQESGNHHKLLTTGLIDPEKSRWGEITCRYLKSRYNHPRIPHRHLKKTRQSIARRPKLIVAGLSRVPECFFDESAEYIGAVSTYTITHPEDDIAVLRKAMAALHSTEIGARFRNELGSAALGGGNITLTKRFLKQVLAEKGF